MSIVHYITGSEAKVFDSRRPPKRRIAHCGVDTIAADGHRLFWSDDTAARAGSKHCPCCLNIVGKPGMR